MCVHIYILCSVSVYIYIHTIYILCSVSVYIYTLYIYILIVYTPPVSTNQANLLHLPYGCLLLQRAHAWQQRTAPGFSNNGYISYVYLLEIWWG